MKKYTVFFRPEVGSPTYSVNFEATTAVDGKDGIHFFNDKGEVSAIFLKHQIYGFSETSLLKPS